MIKNIIFDIGNVLVDFEWTGYIQSFHFEKEIANRVAKATVLSNVWNEFDRGALRDEQLVDLFVENDPEIEKEIRSICVNIAKMLVRREYAIEWIESLKKRGYKVFYLSNFSRKAEIECKDSIDFVSHMDGGIFSYEVKLVKPDPCIYEALLQKYELVASECVFIDDRLDNCEAARALEMKAVQFITKEQTFEELEMQLNN